MYYLSLAAQLEVKTAKDNSHRYKRSDGVLYLHMELVLVGLTKQQELLSWLSLLHQYHVLCRPIPALAVKIKSVASQLFTPLRFLAHQLDDASAGGILLLSVQFLQGGIRLDLEVGRGVFHIYFHPAAFGGAADF
jgi:hypothetical protein